MKLFHILTSTYFRVYLQKYYIHGVLQEYETNAKEGKAQKEKKEEEVSSSRSRVSKNKYEAGKPGMEAVQRDRRYTCNPAIDGNKIVWKTQEMKILIFTHL